MRRKSSRSGRPTRGSPSPWRTRSSSASTSPRRAARSPSSARRSTGSTTPPWPRPGTRWR
ncbi:MAG: hypothetical protein D6685_08495 [Bacteroidetes bacterium]|nr:MAG: hypothetical protein D6685_08495 [Bacteroidota bacterium]